MNRLAPLLILLLIRALSFPCFSHANEPRLKAPKELYGCPISRLDAPGNSMEKLWWNDIQLSGTCYAETAGLMTDAILARDGIHTRVSPTMGALSEHWDDGAVLAGKKYHPKQIKAQKSWIDTGAPSIALKNLIRYAPNPVCNYDQLERTYWNQYPNENQEALAHEHYLKSFNFLFKLIEKSRIQALHQPAINRATIRAKLHDELSKKWAQENFPTLLLTAITGDPDFDSLAIPEKNPKLGDPSRPSWKGLGEILYRSLGKSCKKAIIPKEKLTVSVIFKKGMETPRFEAQTGDTRTEMIGGELESFDHYLQKQGPRALPAGILVCAELLRAPGNYIDPKTHECAGKSYHAMTLKGSARCPGGKRWYLISNSHGKHVEYENKNLLLDQRVDGTGKINSNGSFWISEDDLLPNLVTLTVVDSRDVLQSSYPALGAASESQGKSSFKTESGN